MSVYVDNFYITGAGNFGRMKMSHMVADSTEELLAMVDRIGVQRKWIQYPGTANEHFDISLAKRALAIKYGAKEINFRDYATFIEERCKKYNIPWTHSSLTIIKNVKIKSRTKTSTGRKASRQCKKGSRPAK